MKKSSVKQASVKAIFSLCNGHIHPIFPDSKQLRLLTNKATYLELFSK